MFISGCGEHDFMARLVSDWEAAATLGPECTNVRNVFIR